MIEKSSFNKHLNTIFTLSLLSIILILFVTKYIYKNAEYEVIEIESNFFDSQNNYHAIGNDLKKLSTATEKIALRNENISIMNSYIQGILSDRGLDYQLVSTLDRINYLQDNSYPFISKLNEIDTIQSMALTKIIDTEIASINENIEILIVEFATDSITLNDYESKSRFELSKLNALKKYKKNITARYNIDNDQLVSEYLSNISNYLKIKNEAYNDYIDNIITENEYQEKVRNLNSKIEYYNTLILDLVPQ